MSVLTGMDESGEIVGGGESLLHEPASALSPVVDFEDTSGEVDEDKYGGLSSALMERVSLR